jgi:hypothetical protein
MAHSKLEKGLAAERDPPGTSVMTPAFEFDVEEKRT